MCNLWLKNGESAELTNLFFHYPFDFQCRSSPSSISAWNEGSCSGWCSELSTDKQNILNSFSYLVAIADSKYGRCTISTNTMPGSVIISNIPRKLTKKISHLSKDSQWRHCIVISDSLHIMINTDIRVRGRHMTEHQIWMMMTNDIDIG